MKPKAMTVLETIQFFDSQNLPLTVVELQANLLLEGIKINLLVSELIQILENDLKDFVATDGVFYFLKDREQLPAERIKNYKKSLQNFRRARKFLKIIRHIPFVRGVAISGSQALMNSRDDSDIDLFVITKKNRIWLARFFVSAVLQILGVRRHEDLTEKRFCLNHYIAEDHTIDRDHNLYTAVEYANLIPFFGNEAFEKFYKNNHWIKGFVPGLYLEIRNDYFPQTEISVVARGLEWLMEALGLALISNWLVKKYQIYRIKPVEYVYVSDEELSFHPNSKGQQVLVRFQKHKQKLNYLEKNP